MNKKVIQTAGKTKIAVLGPKNTYCDIAADKYAGMAGQKFLKEYCRSIGEIFSAVEKGRTACRIAPLENVIYGSVRETYDLLLSRNVYIAAKFRQGIDHVLAVLPGAKKNGIRVIASHEQALAQCAKYAERNFPFAKKEYCSSTVAALEKMINAGDRGVAVIIPAQAAKKLPLKILARNLQGKDKNYTSFICVKKGKATRGQTDTRKKTETAIAFYFRSDSPGSLYSVFSAFAAEGINLSYIESRPSAEIPGNYVFYLNFLSGGDRTTSKIIRRIRPMLAGLKILGVYPKT